MLAGGMVLTTLCENRLGGIELLARDKCLVLTADHLAPGTNIADIARIPQQDRDRLRLQSRTTTYLTEFAKQGKDWETEFNQMAVEEATMKKLGLTSEIIQLQLSKSQKEDEDEDE